MIMWFQGGNEFNGLARGLINRKNAAGAAGGVDGVVGEALIASDDASGGCGSALQCTGKGRRQGRYCGPEGEGGLGITAMLGGCVTLYVLKRDITGERGNRVVFARIGDGKAGPANRSSGPGIVQVPVVARKINF